eukprot:3773671-Alexandrium_andersonii.AAC.1
MPAASSRPAAAAGPAGDAPAEAAAAAEAARLRTPAAVTSTPNAPACNPAASDVRGSLGGTMALHAAAQASGPRGSAAAAEPADEAGAGCAGAALPADGP